MVTAIIVPIYAAFVSSADLGEYDYLLTLTQIMAPVAYLAVWEAILKFSLNEFSHDVGTVIGDALRFNGVMAVFSSVFIVLGSIALGYAPINSIMLGIMTFAYASARVWQYGARGLSNSRAYAESGVISSLSFFASVLLFICVVRLGFLGLSIAYILGQLSIVGFLEAKCRLMPHVIKDRFSPALMKSMLRYSTPCVANLVSLFLLIGFGRIVTVHFLGVEANGQYAFAMKFATIVTSIGSIFSMAVIEEGIIRSGSKKLSEFYSVVTDAMTKILCGLISILLPCILLFYMIIKSTDYGPAAGLTAWILVYAATTVMATQFGSIFMAMNNTGSIASTTFIGLIITVAVTLVLVLPLQLNGIILGLVAGTSAMMVSRWVLARHALNFKVSIPWTIGLMTAYFIESAIAWHLYAVHAIPLLIVFTIFLMLLYAPLLLKEFMRLKGISD